MIDELRNIIRVRTYFYYIFKHIFLQEFTEEFLNRLLNDPVLKQVAEMRETNLSEALREFLAQASAVLSSSDIEGRILDLRVEYTRLFIGPIPVVIPYETVYRGERLLKGDTWSTIRNWYLDDGYLLDDKSVLEDHAGVELEYMAHLSEETERAIDSGNLDEAKRLLLRQKEFMEQHLIKWIPRLCRDIEERTREPIYKAFAKLLETFINEDQKFLEKVIEEFL